MQRAGTLFGSGVGIGLLGTLIGAGGGWMIVPLLLVGFRFTPQQAVGTSLVVVFLNALSGSIAYMLQRRILYVMGLTFAVATIPGALLGAWIVQYLDSRWFSLLFGGLLLAIAAFLHRGQELFFSHRSLEHVDVRELNSWRSPRLRLGIAISFVVGTVSS
ncbi:MAG TPA: sulfite exporter TauE/SafE family protein, partial [Candidatus Acidoferrum sp.]|nr:sulfite exporter TauE/SafE family protein [Candidatus Acidoferrum sp.]